MINSAIFSSENVHWQTPVWLYEELNREFHFTFDPCPLHGKGGLDRSWGKRNFINPPYGRKGEVIKWILKGVEEWRKGKLCVFLLPVRTDVKWFHDLILPNAREIRFIRGRLKFSNSKNSAPFPSMIVVFK